MKRTFLTLFFALLLVSSAYAVIEKGSMRVFAVTSGSEIALSAELEIQAKPGEGKVWSSVEPLIGTSTQTTEKIAVQVARNYFDRVDSFDYFFDINSTASLVDGPSAGAAMTLVLISMLQNKELPNNVSITGTITVDGSVGAVGGVFKKAQEAARVGIDLFMIPQGEAKQIVKLPEGVESINLPDYAKREWGTTVVEVPNIDTALKYAFSDIESIDVNTETVFTPDFVPDSIIFPRHLEPMDGMTNDYLSRAEVRVEEARNSLSGTLLNDPSLIDAMLSLLNQSDKTLAQAKLLHDQNYLYSAANYAFLAMVNASLVRDISDNPSLLEPGSTAWDLKLMTLRKRLNALKRDLNNFVPLDYLEWHVAAKERLVWAEEKLEKLEKASDNLVITVGVEEQENVMLENLLEFEYASAWVDAATDFRSITLNSEKRVSSNNYFITLVDSYLVNVEDALKVLTEEEKVDILRRFNAAKIARDRGWQISALFDAASALALANAAIFVKNKELPELDQYLDTKIVDVQQKMSESQYDFVWAKLYLDHAIYYNKAVNFYEAQGENMRALEMAKSGISLALLAENILQVTIETKDYFDSIPQSNYLAINQQDDIDAMFGTAYFATLLVLLLVVIIILLVLLFRLSHKINDIKHYSLNERIKAVRETQDSLDSKWENKDLNDQEYEQRNQAYQKKLEQLLDKKSELSTLLVDIDRDKAMLSGFEHAFRSLKRKKSKSRILKADYQKNFDYYSKQIVLLEKEIAKKKRLVLIKEAPSTPQPAKTIEPKALVVKKVTAKPIVEKKPAKAPGKKKFVQKKKAKTKK
ncbi:MAG: hypothetical protein CL943_02355 [Candidatus Diapherotrites archaeon]|uniref:Lon proteolytic domain-containing protein n=1 Tax=Candidatus Iainarchaeum sp. TaxID=3101447 RepID=A0A2D6M119_9ARCH|nr:hypothetical protein [Candidatus Diapherotrites archaeon]|tara:strand:- start:3545 stop:5980 length:2436 start_codon:yes stop_codon:yes gene_type:complete